MYDYHSSFISFIYDIIRHVSFIKHLIHVVAVNNGRAGSDLDLAREPLGRHKVDYSHCHFQVGYRSTNSFNWFLNINLMMEIMMMKMMADIFIATKVTAKLRMRLITIAHFHALHY